MGIWDGGFHRTDCDFWESSELFFAALNLFDLLVSLTSAVEFILWYYPYKAVLGVFKTICMISVVMTGFLTCLIAVVRMIQLFFPLYIINWRAVNLSILLYSLMIAVLRALFLQKYFISDESHSAKVVRIVQFLILAGVYLIVVSVNVISLAKLYFSQSSHTETRDMKRRATITVMIISVIFCICNIGSVVVYGAQALWSYYDSPIKLIDISYYILLPLNSACNPVVYFIRKKDMKTYLRHFLTKFAGFLCRKEEEIKSGFD